MTDINTLEEKVVKICADLIKIDTTNFGNNESVGENIAAEYVSEFLNALKIENKIVGPDNKRCSVLARIQGTNNELSDLVLHGHLDVVPVEKEKWTKDAFAAVIEKDLLWGRGAVDMKNGNAMILGSIAQLIKEGWKPKRNITIAMFADEEAGGKYGSHYVVNNHGEYFDNASEAVGEVGGFSHTLSNGVRLYLIETAQKGIAWMKLTAKGTAGHGSMINSDNAISKISRAINSLTNYKFPITLRDAVLHLLQETAHATNQQFDPKDPEKIILQLGTLAKLVSATTKNTVNPTMLNAGYKVNVIPGEASAYVDGRFLPGNQESFLNEIKTIVGEEIDVEAETFDVALEAPFENDLVSKMITSLEKEDPLAKVVPYMLSGGTDAKAMSKFGIKAYGFTPLMLPNDLDFTSLFHGHDERIPIDSLKFGARTMYRFLKEI
ncbi:MAG: M20/M25/M40 family metallo-hydrolase [Candidatus Nanopelagicales bacterium]